MQHEPAQPSAPLRILMVLESNFIAKGGGGAESQLRTLTRHLKQLGHDVTVVTPMLPWGPSIHTERWSGIPVARIDYPKKKLIGSVVLWARFGAFLWERRNRYDVWHVHIGHHLGAITCLMGAILKKPVVVKISGWFELESGVLAPGGGPYRVLERRWLKRASVVQAISTRIAGELVKHGFARDRIIVLPNAVDTTRFTGGAAARTPGKPFVAVFTGRLVPEKDVDVMLDAWAAAFAGRDDVRLRLVGNGVLEDELRQRATRLGIAHQVEFLGPRDHVEEVLRDAHVGVLPSRIEGLSNTLLEYMACGLPVIASRVSGSEDFVRPGRNGWLFPVSDTAALATCLREAEALSPARHAEMGRQARADVEATATLPHVVDTLLALYRGAQPRELERPGLAD